MQSYIVIDTEGTSLFKHRNDDGSTRASDAPGQPRMAEFAAVVLDGEFNIMETFQQYVMPVGWEHEDGSPMLEMPEKAFETHGLSMDFLRVHGKDVKLALEYYTDHITAGRAVVGFNAQHDGRQVRAELRRAGMSDLFETTLNTCAMRSITTNYKGQVKKLNGKGGFPRLIDAAAHFGVEGYTEDKHHSALEDAVATAHVARHLWEMDKLLPPAIHYAKGGKPEEA